MVPTETQDYSSDGAFCYSELLGKFLLSNSSGCIKTHNFNYFILCKNVLRMFFPIMIWGRLVPLFLKHILDIVLMGAKKKVLWIAAWWIVATMKDLQFAVKFSTSKQIRNSGSMLIPPFPVKTSIAFCKLSSGPRPAFFLTLLSHRFPESNFWITPTPVSRHSTSFSESSILVLHQSVHLIVCHALGHFNGARAFSFSQEPG